VAERVYQRSALILDAEDGRLSQLSNSLTVLGHHPIYSDDVDQLVLLAREHPGQVGALLLPAQHACAWWPGIRKDVALPLGLSPRSVLPVGAALADSDADALHCDGLRWTLGEPFTPWELRFAVSMVLSANDPNELRLEMRIPCSVPIEVEARSRCVPGQLTDLSTSGAFVELAHPLPEGTLITLRGELAGRPVSLSVRVAWRTGPDSPSWRDRGMGIQFDRVELATLDLIRQQMVRSLDRFQLRARTKST
jgi:PilZ domain-containing protein